MDSKSTPVDPQIIDQWKRDLQLRKRTREEHRRQRSPDAVRDKLLQDLRSFVLDIDEDNLKKLVEFTYHPDKEIGERSWGNNPYFKALEQIADQLFIYQEFLQSFTALLTNKVEEIVPAKARMREIRKSSTGMRPYFSELQQELDKSPNKRDMYDLINGERSMTELWEEFNKLRDKGSRVTKQYVSQLIRELEELGSIVVERKGKNKIARKVE